MNDFLETTQDQLDSSLREFCGICGLHRLKNFLFSFNQLGKKISMVGPKQFLLLREFFLESYDKRLFVDCKDPWNEVRVFEVLRFLDHYERFSSNQKLENEIKTYLKTHFNVSRKKLLEQTMATDFGFRALELKKSLLGGLESQEILSQFEQFAQKIFLKEFGIVLELKHE